MTFSTFEDSSTRAPPRITSPQQNSQQKKNVRTPTTPPSPSTTPFFHPRYLISFLFPWTDEEHARALEEQWIDALGSGGTGASSGSPESDSRARAVLNGIVIGFFFPLLPFFFFRGTKPAAFFESGHAIETAESTVFSYAFLPNPPAASFELIRRCV